MRGVGTQTRHRTAVSRGEAGLSMLEVMIALGILLVVSLGILPLGLIAVSTTENQGHLAARTTEYSQDKMEQLLTLACNDAVTDTRVFPSAATGGTGLAIGGSADPSAPAAGYADYLDVNGNAIAAGNSVPAGWFYRRVWQISSPSANMKQIAVTTIVAHAYSLGRTPQSTLLALKSLPF